MAVNFFMALWEYQAGGAHSASTRHIIPILAIIAGIWQTEIRGCIWIACFDLCSAPIPANGPYWVQRKPLFGSLRNDNQ